LVSRSVRQWIEPILFYSIVVPAGEKDLDSGKFFDVFQSKIPHVFAKHTRAIRFTSSSPQRDGGVSEHFLRVLAAFPSVQHVADWRGHMADIRAYEPYPLKTLPMQLNAQPTFSLHRPLYQSPSHCSHGEMATVERGGDACIRVARGRWH